MESTKRKIAKNFIFNMIYNGLNVIFPLVTIPYLSRILLADGLGKVSYATNIVSWFLLFASLGIPRYGIREIAKNRETKLSKVFSELFSINLLSTALAVLIYLGIILNIPYFRSRSILYSVLGIQLFLNIFNVDWFYQGLEDYQYITVRSIIVKTCSLCAMLLFVHKHEDYIIYALIQSLAVAGNNIFNFIHCHKFCNLSFHKLELRRHIKPILILTATQLAISVYSLLDITMLGMLCNDKVVGYYTNVQKLMITVATITASLGAVLLPELVSAYNENKIEIVKTISEKSLNLIITLTLPITIGLQILAKEIILVLFGNNFGPAILTLQLYAPFIVISTIGNLFGTQLLMTFGKEDKLFYTTILGAISDFLINVFMIKFYAQNGATIATIIAELIVAIAQIYYVEKECRIAFNRKIILTSIISCVMMCLGIYIVKYFIASLFLRLVISVVVGIIIYFAVNIILCNDSIILIKKTVLNKF